MNNLHDLFLLMFNLSQMSDKAKVIELFHESITELFKPHHFFYSEWKVFESAYSEEISTRNFFYGYLLSASEPNGETKQLVQNAIQMLAVILDRLNFEAELKDKVDSLEKMTQQQLSKINSFVEELEIARLASLNLIEDLKNEILERKNTEKALSESEHELRTLAESMPQIVWTTRPDGWNTYFNQQWMDYTGMTLEESYGQGWNKPFHPDDQQRAWDAWQNAVNNNGTYSIEARLRRFDGEYTWWLVRGVPLIDQNGNIQKWYGTCTNIDSLKQSEKELKETQAILQAAMNQSPAGIAIANAPNGDLRYVNKAGLFIRGGDDEEVVKNIDINKYVGSWNILDLDGVPLKPEEVPLARAVLFGEENSREFMIRRNENDDRIVFANAAPIKDNNGKVIAGIVVFLDITERKHADEAISKQMDELRRWYEVTLDREGRVLELKNEVNELLKQNGEPVKYGSALNNFPK